MLCWCEAARFENGGAPLSEISTNGATAEQFLRCG